MMAETFPKDTEPCSFPSYLTKLYLRAYYLKLHTQSQD